MSEATWMTQLTDSVHPLAEEDLPPVCFHHNFAAPLFPIPVAVSAHTTPPTFLPSLVLSPDDLTPFADDEHKDDGHPNIVTPRNIKDFVITCDIYAAEWPKYCRDLVQNVLGLIEEHYSGSHHLDAVELIRINLGSIQVSQLDRAFTGLNWWGPTRSRLTDDFNLLIADGPAVTHTYPTGVWRKATVPHEVTSPFDNGEEFPAQAIQSALELFYAGHTIAEIQKTIGTDVYTDVQVRITMSPQFLSDAPASTRPLAPVSLPASPSIPAQQLLTATNLLDVDFSFGENALGLTGLNDFAGIPSSVSDGNNDDDWKSVSSNETFVSASEGNTDSAAGVLDEIAEASEPRGHGMSSVRMERTIEVVEYLLFKDVLIALRTRADFESQGLEYKDKNVVRKETSVSAINGSPDLEVSSIPTSIPTLTLSSSIESLDSALPLTPPPSPAFPPTAVAFLPAKRQMLPSSRSSASIPSLCTSSSVRSVTSIMMVKAAPVEAVVNSKHVQGGDVAFSYPMRASIAEKTIYILERRMEDAFEILERQEQAQRSAESPLSNVVFLPGSPHPYRTSSLPSSPGPYIVHYPETSSAFVDATVNSADLPFYFASHLRARRTTDPKWTPKWEEALNAKRIRDALAPKKSEHSVVGRLFDAARGLFN